MLILHEQMQPVAVQLAAAIQYVFKIPSTLHEVDLEGLLDVVPALNGHNVGYWDGNLSAYGVPQDKATLVLTERDLLHDERPDAWVFGVSTKVGPPRSIVSTSRLKGVDSRPRDRVEVALETYFNRVQAIGVHEICHHTIKKREHFKSTVWVDAKSGVRDNLGPHCPDNSCVMYQYGDIVTPPEEGYLLVGDEPRYDTGLDEVIARLGQDWLCNLCRSSAEVSESFR